MRGKCWQTAEAGLRILRLTESSSYGILSFRIRVAVRMERQLSAISAADFVGFSGLVGIDELGTLAELKAQRSELIDQSIKAPRPHLQAYRRWHPRRQRIELRIGIMPGVSLWRRGTPHFHLHRKGSLARRPRTGGRSMTRSTAAELVAMVISSPAAMNLRCAATVLSRLSQSRPGRNRQGVHVPRGQTEKFGSPVAIRKSV